MSIQKGTIVLGLGKQTAKGTIAAQPAYAFGVESGGLKIDPEHKALELTANTRASYGSTRNKVVEGAAYKTAAYPGSVGLELLSVLGSVTTTGAAAPYTHTFSAGDTLPYYTFFEKAAAKIFAEKDCKVKSVEFSWEENGPLMISVDADGGIFSTPATFTPTTDEVGAVTYLMPIGGTFSFDVDSGTPVAAPVKGGSIKFTNDLEVLYASGSVESMDIDEGKLSAEVSLAVRPASTDDYQTIITGTSSGTAISTGKVTGSFKIAFIQGATSLTFESATVDFLCGFPEADGKAGPWEVDLAGICYMPSGNTAPIVATLVNAVASY